MSGYNFWNFDTGNTIVSQIQTHHDQNFQITLNLQIFLSPQARVTWSVFRSELGPVKLLIRA